MKLEKAVRKADLSAIELANKIADIIAEQYGKHNFEDFKKIINERLK